MINRTILVGRLTKDVEVRKTSSGISTATFTVAVDRPRSKDGERHADFIGCVAWRQTADFLGQYAKKGALVGVDGRIQTRNYDGQDGRKVYVTEVLADSVQLLSRPAGNASAEAAPVEGRHAAAEEVPSGYAGVDLSGISEDDLPF